MQSKSVRLYFNFRSPYCYLASKRLFAIFRDFHVQMVWRPLGGWDGRSPPDRAKAKIPIARQDVARWARRLGIPYQPPPVATDPTRAGVGSLLAEELGLLQPYVVEVMRDEWAGGCDIGDPDTLLAIGQRIGIDRTALAQALENPELHAQLKSNWEEAQKIGVIGVPTFVIDDQIFWGNDRIDFVREHLQELRLARLQ